MLLHDKLLSLENRMRSKTIRELQIGFDFAQAMKCNTHTLDEHTTHSFLKRYCLKIVRAKINPLLRFDWGSLTRC